MGKRYEAREALTWYGKRHPVTTELAGKTALITGAGGGIGRALAFGQAEGPAPCYASGVVMPPGAPGGKNVAGGEANVSRQSFSARSERGRNDY
jgi:hypothetical protein